MTKTEIGWRLLSQHFHLEERLAAGEVVKITASDISSIARREPRLMVKFDEKAHLPKVLARSSILPSSNGEYLIVPGDAYHEIESAGSIHRESLPQSVAMLETLPWLEGPRSESQLLDMILAAGILDKFLDEAQQHLTIRGRLRSPDFEFDFRLLDGSTHTLQVSGVQIEVDAGLEGDSINLIEAKLGKRSDFHIRQLYYPYRMWQALLPHRQQRSVFVTYSDKVISLRLYRFVPEKLLQGVELVRSLDVVLGASERPPSLESILAATPLQKPPLGVPFPQADDMYKVLDIVDAAYAGITDLAGIVDRYGFTERQVAYYSNAARYLGLMSSRASDDPLTQRGHDFVRSSREARHRIVLASLAELPVFRELLERVVAGSELPSAEAIEEQIRESSEISGMPISGATLRRRRTTAVSWLNWVRDVVKQN